MRKIFTFTILAVIFIGGFYLYNKESAYSPTNDETTSAPLESTNPNANPVSTSTPSTTVEKTFTADDVKQHNNADSCYAIINDNVYDLTSWINKHPGGRLAILAICGRDGSTAFNLQHGKSSKPNAKLATFKIGTVIK